MSSTAISAPGGDGSGVWKWLTSILGTVILMLLGVIGQMRSDMVSRRDMVDALAAQQRQIDEDHQRLTGMESSLTELNRSMGEVKGALGIKEH